MNTIRITIGNLFFIRTAELRNSLPSYTEAFNSLSTFKTILISIYLPKRVFHSPTRENAWCLQHYLLSISVFFFFFTIVVP